MHIKAFSIYDVKTGAYALPFFMHHVGEAVRACIDLGRDMNTTVGRYPSDFALHEIGVFDTDTGLFAPCQPISHGAIVSFLPQQPTMPLFDQRRLDQQLREDGSHPSQDPEGMERAMMPNGRYQSAAEA